MKSMLEHVSCARFPASALGVLADLRRVPEIRVTAAGDHVWVRWEGGGAAVLHRLLPVSGIEFYARRGTHWYRPGTHLPCFRVPDDLESKAIPLAQAITPQPIAPEAPDGEIPAPIAVGLARESSPRRASALRCTLADLGRWADIAPTRQLNALSAAWSEDPGDRLVMLLGRRLPTIAGVRFWGDRLLLPLGFRAEPDVPESALRRALGAGDDDLVVLEAEGFELIPRAAFRPLTRAGVRLALARSFASVGDAS